MQKNTNISDKNPVPASENTIEFLRKGGKLREEVLDKCRELGVIWSVLNPTEQKSTYTKIYNRLYNQKHREKRAMINRKSYEKNKKSYRTAQEKWKKLNRESYLNTLRICNQRYRDTQVRIKCCCGSEIFSRSRYAHEKTKKHKIYIQNL